MRPRYPVLLDLDGGPCLVIGGGAVAARKVRGLLAVGAAVTVVAPPPLHPDLVPFLDGDGDRIAWIPEPFAPGLVDARWQFLIAATSDREVNAVAVAEAEAAGVWANDATCHDGGPAALPAVHRDGPLTLTVSTAGVHPGAARWLRDQAAAALDPGHGELLELVAEVAAETATSGGAPRRLDWRSVVRSGTLDLIREGHRAEAKERLQACLSLSSD